MKSESWLPAAIFAALVLLIATPLLIRHLRESRRPRLLEVRIVTATDLDPIYRDGARHVGPDEHPSIAVALRVGGPGGRERWMAPVPRLTLDGAPIDHEQIDVWPERDRRARVFWFTVECSNVGGVVTPDRAAQLLRFRSFLATEMGRDLVASALPEAHNDDSLGPQPDRVPVDAGTLRLYARVEIYDPERDVRATQSASTAGPDQVLDPGYPALLRSARFGDGVRPELGELFKLSGWEAEDGSEAVLDDVAHAAFGRPFADLVDRRIATSSRSFAAVAVSGDARLENARLAAPLAVTLVDGAATASGHPLRWGEDVGPGDLLVDGGHYTVLLADDGNGTLDSADTIAHCWRRPPAMTTLGVVLPEPSTQIQLVRHAG